MSPYIRAIASPSCLSVPLAARAAFVVSAAATATSKRSRVSPPIASSTSPRAFRFGIRSTAARTKRGYNNSAMASTPRRRLQKPAVFICDLQEKFRNAIWEFDKVVMTTNKVLKAASALSIPVYATTQNAARLGSTVPEIQSQLDAMAQTSPPLLRCLEDKTRFSMWVPSLAAHFQSSAPCEIAIVGIESHICVTQTALDALAAGHKVYIIADGVSSCNREEVPIALARLRAAGATITSSESWLYEVMGDAAIPEFRGMVKLVKETGEETKTALRALQSKI